MYRHRALIVALWFVLAAAGCTPRVDFQVDKTSGAAPLTVKFTDQSITFIPLLGNASVLFPVREQEWSTGDGGKGVGRTFSYTYEKGGVYTVTLTAKNMFGTSSKTVSNLIRVSTVAPIAGFAVDKTQGQAPLTVQFTNTSQAGSAGTIAAYEWDFGDGTKSTEPNPQHVYSTPGTYTVSLTIYTAQGNNTLRLRNLIRVFQLPTASFTFTADTENPLTIRFSDTSTPGSAPITRWQWDFGDNTTSEEQHPSHTYAAPGIYTVSLTVSTAEGSNTRTNNNVRVAQRKPTAAFTYTVSGTQPRTILFTDTSDPGTQPITEWLWVFGDGATSTDRNPQHTYAENGSYTVSLTVKNIIGAHTATQTVLVGS